MNPEQLSNPQTIHEAMRQRPNGAELVDSENDQRAIDMQKANLQDIANGLDSVPSRPIEVDKHMNLQLQRVLDANITRLTHAEFTELLDDFLLQHHTLDDYEYDLLTDHLAGAYKKYVLNYHKHNAYTEAVSAMQRLLNKTANIHDLDWDAIRGK